MKKKFAPVLIGLGLLTLAGCGDDNENTTNADDSVDLDSGEVLVNTDAGEVTVNDLLDELGMNQIGSRVFQMTIEKLLEDKYGDAVDVDELNNRIDETIENMGGEEQFQMILAQQNPGMTVDDYRSQMISNEYSNEFFAEKFDITADSIKDEVVKGAHILIKFDEDSEEDALTEEEALEKAEELIEEINDGGDFAELAREHSEDPGSGANGGELGIVTKGQMVAPFEEALFDLDENEMTDEPVLSDFGYHIILRQDDPSDEELAGVKAQFINKEAQQRPDEVYQAYVDLLDEYNVEFVNDDLRAYIEENYLNREQAEEEAEAIEEAEEEAADEDVDAEDEAADEDADSEEDTDEDEE